MADEKVHPTLAERLVAVLAQTQAVPKAGYNEQQRYRYPTIGGVMEMVRVALAAHGVFLWTVPADVQFTDIAREGKASIACARLTVTFRLEDAATGETMAIAWPAEGQDVGDKAVAKALAAAQKTFLVRTFLLPSLDDEPDAPPQAGGARPRTNTGPARTPAAGVDLQTGEVKTINDRQLAMLRAKLAEANRSDLEACEKAGVSALRLLTNVQLDKLLDWIGPRRKP